MVVLRKTPRTYLARKQKHGADPGRLPRYETCRLRPHVQPVEIARRLVPLDSPGNRVITTQLPEHLRP